MSTLTYYRIKLQLASPLAVGSGEDSNTDSDVILDSSGAPIIPATSIAGAVRHFLGVECDDKSMLFGYVNGNNGNNVDNGNDSLESKVKFYDAVLISDSFITVRDSVALENKVGVKGAKFDKEAVETLQDLQSVKIRIRAKFDKEAVETDSVFETLIELRNVSEDEENAILDAVSAIDSGLLRIGSKTTRGYGEFRVTEIKKAVFCLPDDRKEWVEFLPYDFSSDKCYTDILHEIKNRKQNFNYTRIHLELKQRGAVSIRSYTVKNANDIKTADFVQLSTNDGVPVIPGTSWAGAFRKRFLDFTGNDDDYIKSVWGNVDTNKNIQSKSKIIFSESRLTNYVEKKIDRNAIDRFSAGTKDGALYSEKTVYNGKCSLNIDIKNDVAEPDKCMKIISAVICDLDRGYLAVGGLTSVGRGLFSVEKVTIDSADVTEAMKKADIQVMTGGNA